MMRTTLIVVTQFLRSAQFAFLVTFIVARKIPDADASLLLVC